MPSQTRNATSNTTGRSTGSNAITDYKTVSTNAACLAVGKLTHVSRLIQSSDLYYCLASQYVKQYFPTWKQDFQTTEIGGMTLWEVH